MKKKKNRMGTNPSPKSERPGIDTVYEDMQIGRTKAKELMKLTFKNILKTPLRNEIVNFRYNDLFNKEDLLDCYAEVIEEIRSEE